jgi:hypothetical protein
MDSTQLAQQFLELSRNWLEEQIGKDEHDLVAKEAKVRELGSEITLLWRDIVLLRRSLKGLRHVSSEDQPDYRSEFDRLNKISGIKALNIGAGFLTLDTDTIIIKHQDKQYQIGDFRLDIYMNGYIRMRNIKNPGRYPYYDHPHIRDGEPCVGNHTEAVAKLIAEGQLSTVASLLLSYLHSYNPEDAYCEITYWPETAMR